MTIPNDIEEIETWLLRSLDYLAPKGTGDVLAAWDRIKQERHDVAQYQMKLGKELGEARKKLIEAQDAFNDCRRHCADNEQHPRLEGWF